ncbi:hypothetical protein JCM8202v2_002023 [Rhodotorula sphaerocarpa]
MSRPLDAAASGAPVASSSTTALIRCSQCKSYKRPSDYPLRLVNLEPYHVCLAHKWYWTAAKRAQNWAPSECKPIEQVCGEARMLREGGAQAPMSWLLAGTNGDQEGIARDIASAGNWIPNPAPVRQKKQGTEAQASPMFAYVLSAREQPADASPAYRLTFYVHPGKEKITLTIKEEGKPKGSSAWSRPERWASQKGPAAAKQAPANGGSEFARADASPHPSGSRDVGGGGAERPPDENAATTLEAALQAAAALAAAGGGGSTALAVDQIYPDMNPAPSMPSTGDRDREEMPPPPVPAARPAKRARRVEPSLVSPVPTYANDTQAKTAFSAVTDWTRFLSFPTLTFPGGDIPLDPFLSNVPAPPTAGALDGHARRDRAPASNAPPTAAPPPKNRPLTLAEMLSSSLFEPPDIDLPPRSTPLAVPPLGGVPASTDSPASSSQAAAPSPATAAAATPSSSAAAALATQELVSALASLREGLYGRARGGPSPAGMSDLPTPASISLSEADGGEDDESYYEDSIPDSSSEEEDEEEDDVSGKEADSASDMSSFFESSAEESDEASDGAGDNWLEGFAAQQMGLRRRRRRGTSDDGSSPRDARASRAGKKRTGGEEADAAEIDELDDRSTPRTSASSSHVPTPAVDELSLGVTDIRK